MLCEFWEKSIAAEETASAKGLGNGVPGMLKGKQRDQWKMKMESSKI